MPRKTMEATLDFMERVAKENKQQKVRVTFHGGEPLVAEHELFRQALAGLDRRFGPDGYEVALQSNLWLLDDEFCGLFSEHSVEIGTSLDGPQRVTDRQRGEGYFAQTMRGICLARSHGISVGCIATLTPWSIPKWREVFDFFVDQRLGLSIHASVPALCSCDSHATVTPGQYANLLCEMLDYYVEHRHEICVSSLDQMCRAVGCGEGKICTFRDCLGMFLAVDPNGDIYPCQRFCGQPAYPLGSLSHRPTLEDLLASPVACRMAERQQRIRNACDGCSHIDYCRGGCPYNAWAGGHTDRVKDPYCRAYRRVFDHVQQRLLTEMATEENINAVADHPFTGRGNPLLRKGPLIELVRNGPHPSQVARTARRIVAAVELARGPDIPSVATRLAKMGVARTQQSAEASLAALQARLLPKIGALNNLYLHVTFRCQLNCTHCYARADADGQQQKDMPIEAIERVVRKANDVGFRQVVITGGEPLVHSERNRLLNVLMEARSWINPTNLVLRTNFAMPLTQDRLLAVALAVDQVVVSVDGNQQTHDERRGRGSYAATVKNLQAYAELAADRQDAGELSLATVMRSADIQGQAGEAVRELAQALGVRRTRFRPLLPLGRAKDWDEPPTSDGLGGHSGPIELIEAGFYPVSSCGLGQNLYVEPSGESFPCYAYREPHSYLGNVIKEGLQPVLESDAFVHLSCHNVDMNSKCRSCEVRYLCGGACRAWGSHTRKDELDAAPTECSGLLARASKLLEAAGTLLTIREPKEHG